jgi:hypothetical protein
MTFSRFDELQKAWEQCPPAQILLAGRYGYKPQKTTKWGAKEIVHWFKLTGQRTMKG